MDDIASGLKLLCWILTVLMIPVTIAVICYFPEQPSLPPSTTEASRRMNQKKFDKTDFFRSIKYLFQNKGFLIHMVAYSINVAVSSAAMTLLNQFVLQNFEGAAEHAGRMGFLMIILGMVGIILFGVLMDKTRKYKEIALISYLLFGISFVFLMFSLEYRSLIATYVSCGFVGFFFNGYLPVGFELGVELTFPAQEVTTSGIIVASSQLVGVVVTVGAGYLNLWLGPMWTMAVQAVFVFLGTLITVFIPNKMLRQQAIEGRVVNTERKISHSSK
nr:feline leukemia virus subgroup C receptor-related protein 1-like [Leptinotarsa decemlineata]